MNPTNLVMTFLLALFGGSLSNSIHSPIKEQSDPNLTHNKTDAMPTVFRQKRQSGYGCQYYSVPQFHRNQRRICAIVHEESNCRGRKCTYLEGVRNHLSHQRVCGNWASSISSVEIGSGCKLTLCTGASLSGTCDVYSAGSYSRFLGQLWYPMDNAIQSLDCNCGQISMPCRSSDCNWPSNVQYAAHARVPASQPVGYPGYPVGQPARVPEAPRPPVLGGRDGVEEGAEITSIDGDDNDVES